MGDDLYCDRRLLLLLGASAALSACTRRSATMAPPPGGAVAPSARGYSRILRYQVQAGDTLSSLARRSGLSVGEIIAANGLQNHQLSVGQALQLPGVERLGEDPLLAQPSVLDEPTAPLSEPNSLPGGYILVPRSGWTTTPVGKNRNPMGQVLRITVHHTSEHGDMMTKSDLDIVRSIERYHREDRKWACIGYHFLVGRDGRVYEGRPAKYQGAHTRSSNSNNLGISVIGDCHRQLPGNRQMAALESLLNDMRAKYRVNRRHVFGHRDLSPSLCPGDALYRWLQRYKGA